MVVAPALFPPDSAAAPARFRGGLRRRPAGGHLDRHAATDRHGRRAGRRRTALHPLVGLGDRSTAWLGAAILSLAITQVPSALLELDTSTAAAIETLRWIGCSTRCWRIPFLALLACGIYRPDVHPPDHADPPGPSAPASPSGPRGWPTQLRTRDAASPRRAVLHHRHARLLRRSAQWWSASCCARRPAHVGSQRVHRGGDRGHLRAGGPDRHLGRVRDLGDRGQRFPAGGLRDPGEHRDRAAAPGTEGEREADPTPSPSAPSRPRRRCASRRRRRT